MCVGFLKKQLHLCVWLFCLLIISPAAQSVEIKQLTIAYNLNNPPFKFQNAQTQADGILIDIWRLWSQKTGIPIVFKAGSFAETLTMLEKGRVDAHAGLFYSKDRTQYLDFSQPILDLSYYLFQHESIEEITNNNQLLPYRLGVPEGYTHSFALNHFPKVALQAFNDYPTLYKNALAGNIKLFISPAINLEYFINQTQQLNTFRYSPIKPLYTQHYSVAVKKGNQKLLDLINKGMQQISSEERAQIERKWLQKDSTTNSNDKILIIATDNNRPPFSMLNVYGEPAGLFIDIWKLWAQKQKLKIKFLVDNHQNTLEAVKAGLADFHSGVINSQQQGNSNHFYQVKAAFYYPLNVEVESLEQLPNKSLGIVNSAYIEPLKKLNPTFKIALFDNYNLLFQALEKQKISAFFDTTQVVEDILVRLGRQGEFKQLSAPVLSFAITAQTLPEKQGLLNIINRGLTKLTEEELKNLEKKWLKNTNQAYYHNRWQLELTESEKQWLIAHPIIKIGVDADYAPYAFIDSQGQFQGIAADFVKSISEQLGIHFEVVKNLSWSQIIHAAKNHKLDLITTAAKTEERESFLNFSQIYIPTPLVIMTRSNDNRITKRQHIANKTVALVKDYSSSKQVITEFPQLKVKEVKTPLEGLIAVSSGEADAYIGVLGINTYLTMQHGITNLKTASRYNMQNNGQRFGVRKDWLELNSILDKALKAMPYTEKNRIFQHWLPSTHLPKAINLQLTEEEQTWLNQHPIIKVGADQNWPPFEFADKNGLHQGIAADYLKFIGQQLGITFEVTPNIWKKVLQQAQDKELDILSCAGQTKERKAWFNFSEPYIEIDTVIVVTNDNKQIKDIKDLFGKSVALPKNNFVHEQLRQRFPKINFYFTRSNEEALQAVSLGEADAYVGNLAVAGHFIEKNLLTNLKIVQQTPFEKTRLSLAIRKDWPELLSIINKVLATVNPQQHKKIVSKWLPQIAASTHFKKKISFTEEEKKWLKKNPVISITGNPKWPPASFYENQRYQGIIADYLLQITQLTGLKFEYRQSSDWSNALNEIREKRIDMLDAVTMENTLADKMLFSSPHLKINNAIITLENMGYIDSLKDISDKRIAILKSYSIAQVIYQQFPEIKLQPYADAEQALNALLKKEVDAFIIDIPTFDFYSRKLGLSNLKIAGITPYSFELAFGVRKDLPELQSILNKALAATGKQSLQKIYRKWVSVDIQQRIDYKLIAQIVLIGLILALLLITWNRALAKQVRRRKEAEGRLRLERQRLLEIIDFLPDPTFVIDNNHSVIAWNKAMEKLTGTPASAMLGKGNFEYAKNLYGHQRPILIDLVDTPDLTKNSSLLKTGHILSAETFLQTAYQGKGAHLWAQAAPLYDKKGSRYGAIETIKDISLLKQSEQQLILERQKAEQATKAKSEFLANMSHEIRTPMNAVLGFTELLENQIESPQHKSYLRTIKAAGNNLLMLINDILDLSKIEAGKMELQIEAVNPHSLFDEIANIFQIKMQENNLEFLIEIDPNIPESLLLDGMRLRQLLFNLLGNAVKFTHDGHIKMMAEKIYREQNKSLLDLIIKVQDTGIGIPKSQQDKIFHIFEQRADQSVKKYGGTGLGLSICKRLTEMMNGELLLDSEVGEGSTFSIVLHNVHVATQKVEPQIKEAFDPESITLEPATILVVDDIANNRSVVRENFVRSPITIKEAANGQQAIAIAKRGGINLILMDIRMPLMGGFEAAEEIKAIIDIPIIALTASVLQRDYDKIKSSHFDGYLRKPVLRSDLFKEICRFLPFQQQQSEQLPEILKLNDKALENLETIIHYMESDLHLLWQEAQKSNKISTMNRFAEHINTLADTYQIQTLQEYSAELKAYIKAFDIKNISRCLNRFESLVVQLKQHLNKDS